MIPPERNVPLCGPLEFVGLDAERESQVAFFQSLEAHHYHLLRKWLTKAILARYNPPGGDKIDNFIAGQLADGFIDRMKNPI